MLTKLGKWYKLGNNYELLNELEPFDPNELKQVEEAFNKLMQKLVDNKLKVDEREQTVIKDFIQKIRQRIMVSEQDVQADYEHRNQVKPDSIVRKPEGVGGASDKAQSQQSLNNNSGSNVGT